ncbi:P-loop NTPase family protein [[Mycobacterium] nativiensis]|uniref:hypothetical protein n=1 Tax=[Mycobacterium] nativiensis TaxID=2855503 RepID=UPI0038B45C97
MAQGHQLFVDELTQLTAEIPDPRLVAIAATITAPLRVAVCGRRGVGRRTVAEALEAAGVSVVGAPGLDPGLDAAAGADVDVQVVAETVKPEDTAALAARRRPVLVVLNKADLPGRCGVAEVAGATRAPAESMSALFALAASGGRLDGELWAGLGCLAAQPADISSAERFVSCPHPVPPQTRERLCAVLDLSGIELAVELARRGGTAGQARTKLRRLSGVDLVVARLHAVGAGVYHRRTVEAVARLEALAVGDSRIDEFLTRDATVAARLAAAIAAVGEHHMSGEPALCRARRWQAYRSAPLRAAQQACAADIARGSLRAWAVTRGRS